MSAWLALPLIPTHRHSTPSSLVVPPGGCAQGLKALQPEKYWLSVCKQFFSVLVFGEEIHPVPLCSPAVSTDKLFLMTVIHPPAWCTCSSSLGVTAIDGLIRPNTTCICTQIHRKPANGSWCHLLAHTSCQWVSGIYMWKGSGWTIKPPTLSLGKHFEFLMKIC